MPQPERRPRLDSYGKPLPELAEGRQRVTLDLASNQRRLARWHALIEDAARLICRKGWYGSVEVRITVEDGILRRDAWANVRRRWRDDEEG